MQNYEKSSGEKIDLGQTHYIKYFHKSWREGVRHRAKRLFLGLPLARAVRLSNQRTYSLHEPRVLAIYSSPSLTEIVVLPKLRKKEIYNYSFHAQKTSSALLRVFDL